MSTELRLHQICEAVTEQTGCIAEDIWVAMSLDLALLFVRNPRLLREDAHHLELSRSVRFRERAVTSG